ncbi:deoxyribonuclease TATDN1-like, partial [Saccostrea cucullata]|uniref:deoxyribonuclease TATDN1-like n=1 Tax=Saccostrea cuccullata TaxID=36930 RepID=UPI002ED04BD5
MALAGNVRNTLHKFIDIGVNLTDPMFIGVYHNSKKHQDDFDDVVARAKDVGMTKMMITGGYLEDCKEALELAKTNGK